MSDNGRNSRQDRYDRLLRRVNRFTPTLEYAVALKRAALEVLIDNPIGSEALSEEIEESIRALLPAPQTVFTSEFFAQPVFAVTLVKDVSQLYGCLHVPSHIVDAIDAEKRVNSVLMTNVWLAHAYDPTLERVLMLIDMYETSRIFNPLTLAMPLEPLPKNSKDMDTDRPHPVPPSDNRRSNAAVLDRDNNSPVFAPPRRPTSSPSSTDPQPYMSRPTDDAFPNRKNGSPANHVQPQSITDPRPMGDPTKKALAVEQYFRGTKYTGDLSQSLQNTLRDYTVCAMQLELTARQKSLFFINVFGGTARDYFFEHCREEMTYEELVTIMKNGFDNNARQLAIESELEALTLEKVMKDHDIVDTNVGLTKLADKINSLFPQMPMQSQYPKNKVRFLRKAVLEQDWAKASIAQIVTSNFGFDDLLTSLREQYQLEREVEDAKNKSNSTPGTLYQQYGRNPKSYTRRTGNGNSYNNSAPKSFDKPSRKRLNPIGKNGQRMRCSLCGSIEHFVRDCPPGASRQFVRSNLAKGVPAVHLCHDLLKGIEDLSQLTSDSVEDNPDSSHDTTGANADTSSELLLFDEISEANNNNEATELFDALDETVTTNFITAKVAERATVTPPQMISSSPTMTSDFQHDV